MEANKKALTRLFTLLVAAAYGAAFFLPVDGKDTGADMFAVGFCWLYFLPLSFPWLANPFLWIGLLALMSLSFRFARSMGLIAASLAAGFLVTYWLGNLSEGKLPGIGYWLWVASMVQLAWAGYWLDRMFPHVELFPSEYWITSGSRRKQ